MGPLQDVPEPGPSFLYPKVKTPGISGAFVRDGHTYIAVPFELKS